MGNLSLPSPDCTVLEFTSCHLVSRSPRRSTTDRPFSPKRSPAFYGNLPDQGTIALQLKNGVKALGRSLNKVSDPVATLKFLNNLLNAAANSVSLHEVRITSNAGGLDPREDIRSASFIRELVIKVRYKGNTKATILIPVI
ncbi:MAG: hypothetical protein HC780_13480 [Leptolyngbyaceae cyanobacterium CSU_1_3]|nr:hypothetical protein [Leptolyngbyaceae cyanobacterium CSU_1_3]